MRRFVLEHADFTAAQGNVTKHVNIVTQLSEEVMRRDLMEVSTVCVCAVRGSVIRLGVLYGGDQELFIMESQDELSGEQTISRFHIPLYPSRICAHTYTHTHSLRRSLSDAPFTGVCRSWSRSCLIQLPA